MTRSAMRFFSPSTFSRLSLLGVLGALGCTANPEDAEFGPNEPGATGGTWSGGGTSGGGSSGTAGTGFPGGGSAGTGTAGTAGAGGTDCVAEDIKGQLTPIDIFIMLDRSGSMDASTSGTDRWGQVTKAIKAFVSAPVIGEVGVGIDFFPEQGLFTDYCDANFYANPSVGVAPLPGVAQSIKNAINQTGPNGGTPLAEALEGAVTYAKKVKAAKAGHEVVILLATDGAPEGCNTRMSAVEAQAKSGVNAGIKTFVIGVGDDAPNLDAVAKAGGTGAALRADDGSDIGALFQAKLDEIRGTVACRFQIPTPTDGKELDYDKVAVNFTPEGGATEQFGRTQSKTAAECGDNLAFHYDDPVNPKVIILCPKACERVQGDKGVVNVALGCKPIIFPPPS